MRTVWDNAVSNLQTLFSHPVAGIVITILLLVGGWRMTAYGANWLLVGAWAVGISYVFFTAPLPQELLPKILWSAFFGSVFGLCIYYTLWSPAPKPPSFTGSFSAEAKPDGYEFGGIKWREQYSELDVLIVNESNEFYEDLDIVLKSDLLVARIGYDGHGYHDVTLDPMGGVTARSGRIGNTVIPTIILATDAGYRLRCSRLWPQGSLNVIMATVTVKPEFHLGKFVMENQPDDPRQFVVPVGLGGGHKDGCVWFGHPDANIYSERPTQVPTVTVKGAFTTTQRPHKISKRIAVREVQPIRVP